MINLRTSQERMVALIEQYQRMCSERLERDLSFYESLDFEELIAYVAFARIFRLEDQRLYKQKNKHSHQKYLNDEVFAEVEEKLRMIAGTLLKIKQKRISVANFEELYRMIYDCIHGIYRVGPLMTYDTALRIGANLGVRPANRVFIQQGAKEGLTNLFTNRHSLRGGSIVEKRSIAVDHIGFAPLQKLDAYHIENFLCIYKSGELLSEERAVGCSNLPRPNAIGVC